VGWSDEIDPNGPDPDTTEQTGPLKLSDCDTHTVMVVRGAAAFPPLAGAVVVAAGATVAGVLAGVLVSWVPGSAALPGCVAATEGVDGTAGLELD
jgi:hypothetical protein